jgi:hypothetical protein
MLNWRNPVHWVIALGVLALVILVLKHTPTT